MADADVDRWVLVWAGSYGELSDDEDTPVVDGN